MQVRSFGKISFASRAESVRGAERRVAGIPCDERTPIAAAYEDVWDAYVPSRYRGKVTLLWPEEDLALVRTTPKLPAGRTFARARP